ncbi:MAG: ABC transporter ATP-binding protein [Bacteroidetes bacterium]|nr:ABC transporter ATP-binding protein [Bacteroidota bacterium]MBM3430118.1 ABC transporter ATP-binding protein [Bacteroidota bacterium]
MLIAQNITKSYGELAILKGVNLRVEKSEIVSIVGSSGAGKTTLLQILGTLDKPDGGEIIINGISPFSLNQSAIAAFRNKHIGFIFQFHQLLPEFTAIENVMIPGMIAGTNKKQLQERAEMLLSKLSIDHRKNHKPSELSGGEQQRIAVCRALINEPSVVLADEPSGNLDTKNAKELHELFFKLREEFHQTFVIVTHNEDLANMADRKLTMKDGLFV